MSGSRHESSDLVGLGIAVVSTMLALVVRLILWPLNVFLQAVLRKRYNVAPAVDSNVCLRARSRPIPGCLSKPQ